jgi:hypothetical protein
MATSFMEGTSMSTARARTVALRLFLFGVTVVGLVMSAGAGNNWH